MNSGSGRLATPTFTFLPMKLLGLLRANFPRSELTYEQELKMEKKIPRWSYQNSMTEKEGWQLVMVGQVHLVLHDITFLSVSHPKQMVRVEKVITIITTLWCRWRRTGLPRGTTEGRRESHICTEIRQCMRRIIRIQRLILHECNMPKNMKSYEDQSGNTRVRCKMLYEQNNAPWEKIDLEVSLDTKHLHPHEKYPMESCLYDSIRWSSVDDICCCRLQPIST